MAVPATTSCRQGVRGCSFISIDRLSSTSYYLVVVVERARVRKSKLATVKEQYNALKRDRSSRGARYDLFCIYFIFIFVIINQMITSIGQDVIKLGGSQTMIWFCMIVHTTDGLIRGSNSLITNHNIFLVLMPPWDSFGCVCS